MARLGVAEEVVGLLQECASGVTLVVDNLEEHVVSIAVVGLSAALGVLLRLLCGENQRRDASLTANSLVERKLLVGGEHLPEVVGIVGDER